METDTTPAPPGFSSAKKEVLALLKRRSPMSLAELATARGISKVAALRHLEGLESEGLVARTVRRGGVGRPKAYFELTPEAARLFPAAYEQLSMYALGFIEKKLGRRAVVDLLKQRSDDLYEQHRPKMAGRTLEGRVATLAEIRDKGGYMAELSGRRKACFELLEHNCPIRAMADKYWEACEVERRLFQSLLRADVESTHRVVAGDQVCRFLIRPKGPETV